MARRKENYKSFIDLLVIPNLRIGTQKALQYILFKGGIYNTILLDFPEELEVKIREVAYKQIKYDEFLEHLERHGIIPEPVSSWEYTARPILETLPSLVSKFPQFEIYCYSSRGDMTSSMEISWKLASLTLRTILTEKVDQNHWRKTISESLILNAEVLDGEARRILEKAGTFSVCFTAMGQSNLLKILREKRENVRNVYVEKPYNFTPLSVLERKISLGHVNENEFEKLVLCHIDYIKNYIYRFQNRDRAHYEWVLDKNIWPKLGLEKNEIRALNNLIEI